jgi:hypothetical protein
MSTCFYFHSSFCWHVIQHFISSLYLWTNLWLFWCGWNKKKGIVLATELNSSGSPQAQLLYDSINEREGEISLTFQKIELFIVVCRSPMSLVWWVDGGERVVHLVCSGECIGLDHGFCGVQETK